MRVVVEGQDHAGYPPLEVPLYVPLKLTLDVLLPGDNPLYRGRHEADLAVAEDSRRGKGRARDKGLGDLLLEARDPRGVYGHVFGLLMNMVQGRGCATRQVATGKKRGGAGGGSVHVITAHTHQAFCG